MSAPKMKKRWINSLKSRAEKEKENQKKLKSQLRPCLICRDDKHVTEKRGSGFLVESLEVGKGIPPHDYLVTSEKVITEFGKLMENYVLKFRNPVKSSKKFTEFRLHEIAASSEPYKPGGDTSGIIFIWLKRESEKFPESRLFSVVLEDLENYENFYCYFANVSSKDFVECLRIKQNGSGKYVVEEDGRSCPTYESLRGNNPGHRPLGGAILIDVQGELRCVGMLDFTDDETETVSPVFFSSIFPRKDKREEGGGDKEQPQGQLSDGGEEPPLGKSALDKREGGEGEQQSQGKRAEKEKEQENCTDQGSSSGDNDKNSSLSSLSGSHQGPACSNSCSLSKRVAGDHTKRRKQLKSDSASKDINGHGKTPHKSSESLKSERLPLKEGERGEEGSEEQSSEDKQRNCSDQGLSSGDNDKNSSLSSLSGSYQGPASRNSRSLSKRHVAGDHTKRRKQHKSDLASKDINGRGKTPLKSSESLKKKRQRVSLREDKREEGGGDKEQPQGQLSDGGEEPPLGKSALDKREGGEGEQQSQGKRAEKEKEQENCTDQGSSSGDNDKNSSLSSLSGSHQGPACSNCCSLSKRVAGDHTKRRKQHKSDSASKDINGHGKTPHKSSESLKSERLPLKEGERGEEGSEEQSSEDKQRNCSDQGLSSGDNDKNSSLSSLSGSYQGPASRNSRSLSKRVAGDHTKRKKQHKSDLASKDINGRGKTPLKSSESLKKKRQRVSLREDGRTCASSSYRENARQQETLNQGVDQDTCTQDISWTTKVYNWLYSLLTWISSSILSWLSLGKNSNERVGDSNITEGGPTEPYHITVTAHREALCGKSVTLQCETRGNIREARAKWGKEEKDVGGSPGTSSEGLDLELKKNGVRATVTGKIQQCNISEKLELEVCKNEARAWTTMADTEQDHCNVNNQQDSDSEQEETSESSEEPQEESLQGEDIQPPGKTGEQRKKQPPGDLLERATSGGATGRTQSAEERGEVNGERQPQEESPQEEDKQPLGETGEGGKQQHLGDLLEGATSRGTTGRTQSEQRGESSSEQLQSVEGGKEQPPGKTGEGGQPAVGGVEQPPGETAEGGEEQPPGDVLDVAASRGTAGRKLEERGEVNGERQPQEESPQGEEKQPSGETGEGGKQQPPRDLLEGATSRGTTGRTQSALHLVKSREVYSQEKIMDQDNYKPKIVAGRLKTLPNYSAPLPESLRTTCVGEYLENCGNYSGYMQDSSSSSGGADSSSVKELEPRRRKKIQKRIQKRNARHSKAPSSAALSCDVVQSACSQQQVKVTPDNYPSNITVHAENVVIGDSTELNILRQRPPGIGSFDITIDPPEISLKGGGPCLFWFIPDLPSDISSGTAKFFGLHQGFVKLERVEFAADCLVCRGIPSAEKEGCVTVGVVGKNDKTGKCNDLGQAKIYYYDERRNVLKQIVQNERQCRDFFETWKTAFEGHSTAGRVPKTESPSSDYKVNYNQEAVTSSPDEVTNVASHLQEGTVTGSLHRQLGDLKQAKDCEVRALDICLKQFGAEDLDVATSYQKQGSLHSQLGDLRQAKDCEKRALDFLLKQFGLEHPDFATSYQSLGSSHSQLGGLKQAKDCEKRD